MMTRSLLLVLLLTACGDNHGTGGAASDASTELPDANGSVDASAMADAAAPPDGFTVDLACTLGELQPLLTCAVTSCSMNPTPACLLTSCGLLLLSLSPSCRTCIFTALTSPGPAEAAEACGFGDLGGLGGV
ncbi:MAG: hypothetical protein M3680_17825 [Myxococcota bacterium]|nr:hypothetical protein [Myxococcota bacterium]